MLFRSLSNDRGAPEGRFPVGRLLTYCGQPFPNSFCTKIGNVGVDGYTPTTAEAVGIPTSCAPFPTMASRSIMTSHESTAISGRNRDCALGCVPCTALPRPELAAGSNRWQYDQRLRKPATKAAKGRPGSTCFQWKDYLGRFDQRRWLVPDQGPSSWHVPSHRKEIG